jgi:hypothetical protein
MSNRSEQEGLIRVKEHVPYYGKGIDELIAAVRTIFSDNKRPQKLVLEAGVRHIYLEKLVPPDEAKDSEAVSPTHQSIHDAIRNAKLEEYEVRDGMTPFQQLFEMFAMVQNEGLEVCHLVVGDKAKFQKWLGLRIPQNNLNLLGTPITITGEIPDDVFVVCGGPTKTADPYEITYTVKGNI